MEVLGASRQSVVHWKKKTDARSLYYKLLSLLLMLLPPRSSAFLQLGGSFSATNQKKVDSLFAFGQIGDAPSKSPASIEISIYYYYYYWT